MELFIVEEYNEAGQLIGQFVYLSEGAAHKRMNFLSDFSPKASMYRATATKGALVREVKNEG